MSLISEFFDFSNDYLFVLKEGEIVDVNATFYNYLGYEKGDLIGKNIQSIILPKDLDIFNEAFNNKETVLAQVLTEKRRAIKVEWSFLVKDDSILVKGVDVTEKLGHKQRFEQYSVLLRGVNESLERSSHRLFLLQSTLTNTIPYAKEAIVNVLKITLQTFRFSNAYVTKPQGDSLIITDIVGENDSFKNKIITNPESLSQKVFTSGMELIHSLNEHDLVADEEQLDGGKFYLGFPIVFNHKIVGTTELVFDREASNFDFDNNDIQFIKLITEVLGRIIELQSINGELEDKSRRLEIKNNELDEFAHIVSHDLKAPLRAIKNLISFIETEEGNVLTKESKEDFDLIGQRANRMSSLIEGVLEYSRVGREESPTSTFDIYSIINEVSDQLRPMNPNVEFDIVGDRLDVRNKELFCFQIVSNLISNAIKYNDKDKPIIRVSTKLEDNIISLSVEDNGPGIEEQFRDKVFGVFETLQARDVVESTGIGLTIVKKMSLLMGGNSFIEDSELGGAKFVVTFSKKL